MRIVSRFAFASFLSFAVATAHSQSSPAPLFASDIIPHSGCYAPRCFESIAALDHGTAVAAAQQLITVSIRGPQGWVRQQDILNPDIRPPRDYPEGQRRVWPPFASAIGLSGDELLVSGSSAKYNFKDVVYVFARANGAWSHTQTLALLRPSGFEQTVVSQVALEDDLALIVGTRYDDQDPNAAFVQVDMYVRTAPGQWARRGSFKPPAGSSAEFGASIDMDGRFAILGDPAAGGSGRAHVYEYVNGTWKLRRTFSSVSSSDEVRYGSHVAISGNTLAIAAPGQANEIYYQVGAVHMFALESGTWRPVRVVREPALDSSPEYPEDVRIFGTSLALDGERALIGAAGGVFADMQPHGYLLERRTGWQIVARFVNYEAPFTDRVFVSGSTAIVEGLQEWGDRTGYVFELPLVGQLPWDF